MRDEGAGEFVAHAGNSDDLAAVCDERDEAGSFAG